MNNNTDWKKWLGSISRHAAIPTLVLAVIAIGGIGGAVYGQKDQSSFYIKDIAGDRQALKEVVISGELKDGFHSNRFSISNGQVLVETDVYEQPEQPDLYRYSRGGFKRIGNREYEVHGLGTFSIMAREKTPGGRYVGSTSAVHPALVFPPGQSENSASISNVLEYGLAASGDNIYFTAPVTWDYGGRTAIYEWNQKDFTATGDPADLPPARTVAEWDLTPAEEDSVKAMDVLGLEAVGDKLVVVTIQNGELLLRAYDRKTGNFAGEDRVPGIDIGHNINSGENQPKGEMSYVSEPYQAFSDNEAGTLTLLFDKTVMPEGAWAMKIVCFQFTKDGIITAQNLDVNDTDVQQDRYYGQTMMDYRDDKLYWVRTVQDNRLYEGDYAHDQVLPKHLWVTVYKDGQSLYKGELVTDLNEDTNAFLTMKEFNYDQMKNRNFANLAISGAE
ncbi:hypothetical protein [Gorillibacterium massiliense]|uniref:hypothetical protein n=1 Tax=Gorillibacterium massiliense TaxID=1280390 RepID=UPI0004AD3574|nr:hypothetical protein [Gorillibacterium massiliense]